MVKVLKCSSETLPNKKFIMLNVFNLLFFHEFSSEGGVNLGI